MKIKIPKEIRKVLGLKKKSVELEELAALVLKLVRHFLQGTSEEKRPSLPTSSEPTPILPVSGRANGAARPAYSPVMQSQLEQAVRYQQEIRMLAETAVSEFDQMRVERMIFLVDDWVATVHDLAGRVDGFWQNELIQQDLKTVPQAISDMEKRLETAENPLVREELSRTLANRRQQLAALEKLRDTMQWAEVRIESTISLLGAIYSQLLISRSKGKVVDYGRLLDEAGEEVQALHDYLEALQEVKTGG